MIKNGFFKGWTLFIIMIVTSCGVSDFTAELTPQSSDSMDEIHAVANLRTVIFMNKVTEYGQDIFIKGGHDERLVPAIYPTMAEPITYLNTLNPTTAPIKSADDSLDWFTESALDWTTDYWPPEWGQKKTYAEDGYGEDPENTFGRHWWKLDVLMDGSVGDWYEFKAFMREGTQEWWESNREQQNTPHNTINHWGKKGYITRCAYDQNWVEFIQLEDGGDVSVDDPGSQLAADWWKTAVFYECFVRAYKDSDGDGHGDIQGLIEKLDYLQDLGITGLWLMPVTESGDNLNGYTTVNYREIEDSYGDLDDYQLLLDEAHERNIGVVLDLVVNHSSSLHPFFQQAKSSITNEYRNWYVWSGSNPGWFDLETGAPLWHQTVTGYFYAYFGRDLPDFNFHNEAVKTYMNDNTRYWLNLGVDGYRIDAADHLYENGPYAYIDQPEAHIYYQEMRRIVNQYENRFMISEANVTYIKESPQEFHAAFDFRTAQKFMWAIQNNNPSQLHENMEYGANAPAGSRFAYLLTNHDSFTGPRPFTAFGDNEAKCKLGASLLLSAPAIPFIYYGEEIGMKRSDTYPDHDSGLRTPMQWTDDTNAGFTTGTPFRVINENYTEYNVADESAQPDSILSHYKTMITIRKNSDPLTIGNYEQVWTGNNYAYMAYLRSYNGESVVVVLNFQDHPANITLNFNGTSLAGQYRNAGNDLYDSETTHADLTSSNYTAYQVSSVPAFGVRLIPLN